MKGGVQIYWSEVHEQRKQSRNRPHRILIERVRKYELDAAIEDLQLRGYNLIRVELEPEAAMPIRSDVTLTDNFTADESYGKVRKYLAVLEKPLDILGG